ncbi:MAG: hypothetical protein ACRCWQ_12440, partial [Bacilli bacterium]
KKVGVGLGICCLLLVSQFVFPRSFPKLSIKSESMSIPFNIGSHCWLSKGVGKCVDMIYKNDLDLARTKQLVSVRNGAYVELNFSYAPDEMKVVQIANEEKEERVVVLSGNGFNVPPKKGIHNYVVTGTWEEGTIPFGFRIENK